jgi:hypothetical protein
VVNYDGTLYILDVSDPHNPQIVGSYDTPGGSWDVRVAGDRAYVADGVGGLLILNVSDPQHPAKVGAYATWPAYKVKVVGNRVYIAGGTTGLQILDAGIPAHPAWLGDLPMSGFAVDVDLAGDRAYVAKRGIWDGSQYVGGGLEVVNIVDSSHPASLGSYALEYANSVQVIGDRAYIAGLDGLHILNIANPSNITELGTEPLVGVNNDLQVVDNRVYMTFDSGATTIALAIIDVSNPAAPALLSSFPINGLTSHSQLQAVGNLVYVAYDSAMDILDVSDAAHPQFLNRYYARGALASIFDLHVVGSLAYLAESADNDGELEIVDVSNPRSTNLPSEIIDRHMSGHAVGVQVVGKLAYIASEEDGLQILRIHQEYFSAQDVITPNGGGLSNRDGSITVEFPPNAVSSAITVTYAGLFAPTQALDGASSAGRSFTLEARDSGGQRVTQFALPYTMVISYTDEELAALGIDEASLNVAFWNGSAWVDVLPCAGCGVDTVNNRVTVVLDHFTEFALVAELEGTVEQKVFLPLVQR